MSIQDPDAFPGGPESKGEHFARKVIIVIGLTLGASLLVVIVWKALYVLLLIFAGILIGIFLHSLKCQLAARTRLPRSVALVLVLVVLFVLVGLFSMLVAPVIKEQTLALIEQIPESIQQLRIYMLKFRWGEEFVERTADLESMILGMDDEKILESLDRMVGIFSTTFGAFSAILFIIVIGIYLAAELETYFNGIIHLIPFRYRPRGIEVLNRMGHILRWWLLGQSISMLLLGTLVFLGLSFLNVPNAIVLALFTAIMTFIPNLGPIIAYVPTALVTLTQDPVTLIYVTLFYVFIQTIEGFFITPMVHRKVITVPPMLILSVQVLLFYLIGFLGVVLAMPLIACVMVLVQMLYVEDVLGDLQTKGKIGF